MQLYVLRHGRAVDAAQWSGSEFDRPLTDEGRHRTYQEAKVFARVAGRLERIVTSPLVRAQQTAAIVAAELGIAHRLVEDERLGHGFSIEHLGAILSGYRDARAVMIVGHEPSLSATIGALVGNAHVVMKKGGFARIDLHDPTDLRGELVWLASPKLLLGAREGS